MSQDLSVAALVEQIMQRAGNQISVERLLLSIDGALADILRCMEQEHADKVDGADGTDGSDGDKPDGKEAIREAIDRLADRIAAAPAHQINVPQAAAPAVNVAAPTVNVSPVLRTDAGQQWRIEPELDRAKQRTGAFIVTKL